MSGDWEDLLDLLEAEVKTGGETPVFMPPVDLGPLPARLVERAMSLLGRMAEREQELERRRGELGRELSALSAARTATAATGGRPVPRFLDTTA